MDRSFSAAEHFRQALALLDSERDAAAFEHLRAAHALDRANPRYRSFFGLGLARVERRFNKAVELCRSAVKEEFFCPELYHNLAQVYLAFGFKGEGLRYLRRGLMIDPANAAILETRSRLGLRRQPLLRFFPRRHFFNRCLGRALRRACWPSS